MTVGKRWWKNRVVWLSLAGVSLAVTILLGVSFAVFRYRGERDLAQAIAETDNLDPNWRLDDLQANRRPMPPPGKNGYEQVMAAVEVMPAGTWPQLKFPQWDGNPTYQARLMDAVNRSLRNYDRFRPTLLHVQQADALRSEVLRAKTCLDLARRMIEFPYGRGPAAIPAEGPIAGSLAPMRILGLAKMLGPDGRLRIYEDNSAGAIQDARAMLHISRAIGDEPELMAQLVRDGIDELACQLAEQISSGGEASDTDLALLQAELAEELHSSRCIVGILGERALMDHLMADYQEGRVSKDTLHTFVFGNSAGGRGLFDNLVSSFATEMTFANVFGERSKRLRGVNELQEIARLPYKKRFKKLHEHLGDLINRTNSKLAWLNFSGTPDIMFARYLESEVGVDASLTCTITAIAAERFRLANKRWPARLEELQPRFLKAIPEDPYTGDPLRLTVKNSMRIIYSVGANTKDDGGAVSPRFSGGSGGGTDIGFVLHDPEQRRKPGAPVELPEPKPK